jgi:hypothetical protein
MRTNKNERTSKNTIREYNKRKQNIIIIMSLKMNQLTEPGVISIRRVVQEISLAFVQRSHD